MSVCLSVYLSIYLHISTYRYIYLSTYLSIMDVTRPYSCKPLSKLSARLRNRGGGGGEALSSESSLKLSARLRNRVSVTISKLSARLRNGIGAAGGRGEALNT